MVEIPKFYVRYTSSGGVNQLDISGLQKTRIKVGEKTVLELKPSTIKYTNNPINLPNIKKIGLTEGVLDQKNTLYIYQEQPSLKSFKKRQIRVTISRSPSAGTAETFDTRLCHVFPIILGSYKTRMRVKSEFSAR
jgi:hypothetical protein